MKQQAQHLRQEARQLHHMCVEGCGVQDLFQAPYMFEMCWSPKAMHQHPSGGQLARSQRCVPDVHSRLSECQRQMSDSQISWSRPILLAKVCGKGLSSA